MSDIFTKQMDFWKSPKHEAWMLSLNCGDDNDYHPVSVEIEGKVYDYTTCTTAGDIEPWEHALERFPDYTQIATGTLQGFRYRKALTL